MSDPIGRMYARQVAALAAIAGPVVPPRPRVSEHTDAARLEATRDAIRTGTAPRPRVEGEAAWLTMDEHEAQGYDLPKRAVGSKSHWLAMADRWTVEAKAQRAERARLTAEVERLREDSKRLDWLGASPVLLVPPRMGAIVWTDGPSEVPKPHDIRASIDAAIQRNAALSLPTPAPEAR